MPKVMFLNGPNANLYGQDTKGTYGTESYPQIKARCEKHARAAGIDLDFRQSNSEGELIDWIQEARQKSDGLIINGAGLTYTSIAILDALLALEKPIIEVHMSNIYRREPFRHHSFISKAATGIVAGSGRSATSLRSPPSRRCSKGRTGHEPFFPVIPGRTPERGEGGRTRNPAASRKFPLDSGSALSACPE